MTKSQKQSLIGLALVVAAFLAVRWYLKRRESLQGALSLEQLIGIGQA
jgi:hypothetical protein